MQEIRDYEDDAIMKLNPFNSAPFKAAADKAAMSMKGFIQTLEKTPVKPPSPDLHRKAVAKRKKRKRGGPR